MMLFRIELNYTYQPTEEDQAKQKQDWGSWIGNIASRARLVSTSQLDFNGKQLQADLSVKEGIYVADNTILGRNMVVKAKDLDDAIEMAKGCPILSMGGTVEVRGIVPM